MIRRPPRSPLFPYTPLFRPLQREPGRRARAEAGDILVRHAQHVEREPDQNVLRGIGREPAGDQSLRRSEEHTSELQSQSNLVCRLLLEKKKRQLSTYRVM